MPVPVPAVPAPLRVRPPRQDDLDALTELYIRANVADIGEADTDTDDVESIWRWPGFDLAHDAVLIVDEQDRPAAYAWVHKTSAADLTVDPGWRAKGVGGALLAWLVARATEQAEQAGRRAPVQLEALTGDKAATRLLEAAGFHPTRATLLMGIDLTDGLDGPVWPPGAQPRPFDTARDARAAHALVTEAFRDVAGTTSRSFEQWATFTIQRRGFDPGLCLRAVAAERLVGVAVNHRFEGDGFVQYLAVARDWRRQGLGEALLRASFQHMASLGMPRATLYVDADNTTGAGRLYERAGMRVRHRWDRWELPVGPA
jgi:mycothiol synthase